MPKPVVGLKLATGLGPLVDSGDHFPATARAVRALRRTRSWFESSLHVPRKVCSRACHLSLYGSLRYSQHLGCLKDRETVRDAELKCCAASSELRHSSSGLGRVSASLSDYEVSFVLANLLIQRHMDLAWPFAQLHPGACRAVLPVYACQRRTARST